LHLPIEKVCERIDLSCWLSLRISRAFWIWSFQLPLVKTMYPEPAASRRALEGTNAQKMAPENSAIAHSFTVVGSIVFAWFSKYPLEDVCQIALPGSLFGTLKAAAG
jgi:hypothetical protein